jgi:hypothetical protein
LQQVRSGDPAEAEQEEVLQRGALGHLGEGGIVTHHEDRVGMMRFGQQGALVGAGRVPMTAAAGGMMMRRRRSTASSNGSRIQFARPASRSEAGSSCGSTWPDGRRASMDSDM